MTAGTEARSFDGGAFLEEPAGPFASLEYTDPFTFSAWIQPDCSQCAILSHSEDFLEAAGHGLYIIDGKLRLHVTFRWDDIALRMETVQPLKLHKWQHVLVTYDGAPLEFPSHPPTHEEITETEHGHLRLAGYLIRRQADRTESSRRNGRTVVRLLFDH